MVRGDRLDSLRGKRWPSISSRYANSNGTCMSPFSGGGGLEDSIQNRFAADLDGSSQGVGEGPAFPAIHSMISRAVPAESRSTAVAAVTASSYVGCVAALSLSPGIIEGRGWPSVFYIFGASGFAWLPLWAIYTSRSSLACAIGQKQLPSPSSGSGGSEGGGFDIALIGKLAKERGVLAILAAQYTQSWGLYGSAQPGTAQCFLCCLHSTRMIETFQTPLSFLSVPHPRHTRMAPDSSFGAIWRPCGGPRRVHRRSICCARYPSLGTLTSTQQRQGPPLSRTPSFEHIFSQSSNHPGPCLGAVGLASGIIADRMISGGTAPKDCRCACQPSSKV